MLERKDTWNASASRWAFPQTPSRVQLSLWPGGLPTNGKGTIDWAGGLVDWNSPLMQNGYYFATFDSVTMTCYDAKSGPGTNNGVSYTYNSLDGTNDTVIDGKKSTVLKSLLGTGLNMNAGDPSSSDSSDSSKPSDTPQNTVPGMSGGSPGSNPDSSSTSGGSSSPDSSSGGGGSGSGSGGTGFSQGLSSTNSDGNSNSSASSLNPEGVLKGSVFAAVVAVFAMMAI